MQILILVDLHRSSYKLIAELYRHILLSLGYDVSILKTPTSAVEREKITSLTKPKSVIIHITIGESFIPIKGAYNIAQPWHEWSRFPENWIRLLNNYDEVWSISGHVSELLKKSGLENHIEIVSPELVPEEIPNKISWMNSSPTRFYFVGEPHFRKGNHILMQGFIKAFPKIGDAKLTIKTSPDCEWDSPRKDIFLIKEFWEREKLLAEYSKHDCFVSASLAEGLGLPIAEAIKARTPICTNYWGGHKSLLKKNNFIEIEHEETYQVFTSNPEFYSEDQKCAYSSPSSVAQALLKFCKLTEKEKADMVHHSFQHLVMNYGKKISTLRIKEKLQAIKSKLCSNDQPVSD